MMTKSDKSKHDICIASIKRCTFKPYEYKLTKFYETNSDFYTTYPNITLDIFDEELIISSTIIDACNFSVLTTRQLITMENGFTYYGDIETAIHESYGDFKGYKTSLFTFGHVRLKEGHDLKYFIEIGNASMIMIHGVRTLIRVQKMSTHQVENLTRIWSKQNDNSTCS